MSAQWYDANISLPGCDKNMPGSLIAMARLNRCGRWAFWPLFVWRWRWFGWLAAGGWRRGSAGEAEELWSRGVERSGAGGVHRGRKDTEGDPLHTPAPHLITKTTQQPLDHDLRRHDQARPLGGRRLGARHRVGVPVVRCGARTASMDCCCMRTAVMCSCSLWRLLASQATRSRRSSLLFERQQTQNPHTAPNQSPFRRLRRRPLD